MTRPDPDPVALAIERELPEGVDARGVAARILDLPWRLRWRLYSTLGVLPVDQRLSDLEFDLTAARSMRDRGIALADIARAVTEIEAMRGGARR